MGRTPLALPLLALVGVLAPLLGGSNWLVGLSVMALLLAFLLKEWRISLAIILVSAVGFLHLQGILKSESSARADLLSRDLSELSGVIVRTSDFARFVQLDGSAARVELRGEHLQGKLGDELEFCGIVREIEDHHFDGCFDRAAWLSSWGVVAQVEVLELRVLPPTWNWWRIRAYSDFYRAKLSQILMPQGTEADARRQVLCALLLGQRRLAAPETLQVFQWSGTLHAFAVSGLHVGLVAGILWFVFNALRVPPRWSQILILVVLAAYVFLTGMAVASQRAYVMIFFLILGALLRRQVFMANLICLAALLILLVEPRQLSQAGFLLSFVVYMGICLAIQCSRKDKAWFGPDEYIPRLIFTKWERFTISSELSLRSIFIVAMSACLVSLPLSCIFFSSFSVYSVIANICITPILPLVMSLGLLMLMLNWVPVLSTLCSYCALQASGLLLSICAFFAGLPSSFIATVPPSEAQDFAIFTLSYNQHAVLLGNPSVLLHGVNASTAQWTLCPAIRAAGFQPKLIIEPARSTAEATSKYMQGIWSDIQLYPCGEIRCVEEYQIGENTLRVYPATCLMKRPLADDQLPIIHWQSPKGSLLYIGNASASTYYYWKEQGADLSAHTVILGYNKKQPFLDEEELQMMGVQRIIKLQEFEQGTIYRNQLELPKN